MEDVMDSRAIGCECNLLKIYIYKKKEKEKKKHNLDSTDRPSKVCIMYVPIPM